MVSNNNEIGAAKITNEIMEIVSKIQGSVTQMIGPQSVGITKR